MNYPIVTYSLYLALSIPLTIWVARTLSKNGRVFLVDCFRQNADLADSVNHLLVVGFYLLNLGFIAAFLRLSVQVESAQQVFEVLSSKMGAVLVTLGFMHFFNLFVFALLRRAGRNGQQLTPPPFPCR